jgi:hypothetical protein
MQFCSVFNPSPIFTAVTTTTLTVSGMTLAGFVKNAAGGLLYTSPLPVTIADGGTNKATWADTQLVYASAANVLGQSANLTFDGTNLVTTGDITSFTSTYKNGTVLMRVGNVGSGFTFQRADTTQTILRVLPYFLGATNGLTGTAEGTQLLLFGKLSSNFAHFEVFSITYNTSFAAYTIYTAGTTTGVYAVRPLRLYTGTNTTQLVLNTDGRVGIGTADPSQALDVVGNINASLYVYSEYLYANVAAYIGVEGDESGLLRLFGATSGHTELVAQAAAGGVSFYLPNTLPGVDDYPLITSTGGIWSWNDQAVKTTSAVLFGSATLGGSTTKLDVEADGDTFWTGAGSGLPYGSFYGNELSATYAVNNSYARIADTGCFSGEVNLVTYTDAGTTLTVSKAGRYLINWAVSCEATSANIHVLGGIMIDSTTALQDAGKNHFETTIANRQMAMSGTAVISCPNGNEVIGVGIGSDSNTTLTVDHVNLSIIQVGG